MPLPTHCVYRSDKPTSVYDFARNMDAALAYAAKLTNEKGESFSAATLDDFCDISTRYWLAQNPLHEISESEWYEMLEVLPPIYKQGALGFFMSEFTSGTVTNQYVRHNGKFYCAAVDMANRATWIKVEQLT